MTTGQTYFYVFDQNNSGGYFVIDENVSDTLVIEAHSEKEAADRLLKIINQKPEYTAFCPCCGSRWYPEHPDVYTRYWVTDEQKQEFEEESNGRQAMYYPLEGIHRFIPWARYGMYKYLPYPEFECEEEQDG
ncbi:TPA: hypothetical protein U1317_001199 [Streptococcus suis]|nr:hypothetical protein [Streptococcus suis]HEM5177950.1 hypothetical protein [Streptococcus suis]